MAKTGLRIGIVAGVAVIVLGMAGFFLAAAATEPLPTGSVARGTLTVKGMQRTFIVYTPKVLKPNAPLLFVFHGSGGNGDEMRDATGFEFDLLADKNGFVVVYPNGFEDTWNDCRKGSSQPARRQNIDDESFVDAMIAKEAADHAIDRKRVFSAGWSNGGQLGFRFALERPSTFAGVAAISASLPLADNLACTPSGAAMPMLIVNGTADPINPFAGGDVRLGSANLGPVHSSEETAQYWAKLNGLSETPTVSRLPHKLASDPTSVEERVWSAPGKPGVVLYAVQGGGHVIPQRVQQVWGGLGRQTVDLDAPVAIWDFFSKAASKP